MIAVWITFIFLLGLTVGSFLNVVIYRLPLDQSVVRPGSHCPHCKHPIRPWHNIPLLSYMLLRGKCADCKKPMSIRYPMVELLTGILFVTTAFRFGVQPILFIHDLPFVAALIAITFIDLEHRIIPDELSLGVLVLGLATSWVIPELGLVQSLLGAAVGFGIFYGFAWLYEWRTGRSGMGGGDIKLLAALGAYLGPQGVLVTILISSISGSLIGVLWAVLNKEKRLLGAAIPYGPFLVIGGLYSYWIGDISWLPFMKLM